MDYFIKIYKARCNEAFGPLGFKAFRNNHYRVTNDVYQYFRLTRSISGFSCDIEWGVAPLCIDGALLNKDSAPNFHYLSRFENNILFWHYDRRSEESIDNCISSLIEYAKTYLIPYFERSTNCLDAYQQAMAFEKKMCERYQSDCDSFLLNSSYCCMALKNGEYDEALKYLAAFRRQNEESFEENRRAGIAAWLTPESKEYIGKVLAGWDEKIAHIKARDIDWINNYIETNERKSRIALGLEK